jgi:putative PIN family toxin of toxin-antitoxin system
LLDGKITLLISNDIVNEYVEKLEEKANAIIATNILDFMMRSPDIEKIEIYFKWSIITKDEDDNKFVDCALNGQANFLVTDDKHFNVLKRIGFPPIEVIRTEDFLKEVNQLD